MANQRGQTKYYVDLMQPYFHVNVIASPLIVGSTSEALVKDPHNPFSFLPKINTVFHITTEDNLLSQLEQIAP